jgi:8-oxo-dGTP diphosphatase
MIPEYVGAFLYNPKTKEVLLHKRDGNTKINPHKWAFFGGLVEVDETPTQALVRELQEELGLTVSPNEIISLRDYFNESRQTHRYTFYVVSDKQKEEMVLGEGADFEWIPLDKVFTYDLTEKVANDLRFFLETI